MKLLLFTLTFGCFLTLSAKAQSSKTPRWMSGKGYWVIESNTKTPKNSTIYFYTNQHELIYKESVAARRINTNRIKVRKQLEAVLKQAVTAWENGGLPKEKLQVVKR